MQHYSPSENILLVSIDVNGAKLMYNKLAFGLHVFEEKTPMH